MLDLAINSSITHSLLLVVPVGCALLLRWARCPGWPIVGGAAAGLILGPTILGRTAPEVHEKLFVGGVAERETRDAVQRQHEIDRLAMIETGRTASALAELEARHRAEREAAEAAWAAAAWSAQRPLRSYSAAFIVIILLGAGLLRVERSDHRVDPVTVGSIGLWSGLLPGGLAAAALVWLWQVPPASAALAAAAVTIGPWALSPDDRAAADDAEVGGAHLMQTAGRLASVVAIAAVATVLAMDRGPRGLVWAASLLALPVGWCLPLGKKGTKKGTDLFCRGSDRLGRNSTAQNRSVPFFPTVRTALEMLALPSLAACVALRVDLHAHLALWPIVVFVLLSGDGRWLGAFTGAILHGRRRGLRTMRLALPAMAAGPTQLAVAAIAVYTWTVPEFVGAALLAGALLVEITAPLRRRVAEHLAATEDELADLE